MNHEKKSEGDVAIDATREAASTAADTLIAQCRGMGEALTRLQAAFGKSEPQVARVFREECARALPDFHFLRDAIAQLIATVEPRSEH